jgi:hypothetical protein
MSRWEYYCGDPVYLRLFSTRWGAKRWLRKAGYRPDLSRNHYRDGTTDFFVHEHHPANREVKSVALIGYLAWGGKVLVEFRFLDAQGRVIPSPAYPGQQEAWDQYLSEVAATGKPPRWWLADGWPW